MKRELFIQTKDDLTQIALVEEGLLVEFYEYKRYSNFNTGDIFLGKVKKLMPGLNAAFVDIGHKKDAFLHFSDLGENFFSLQNYVNVVLKNKNVKDVSISNFTFKDKIPTEGKIEKYLKSNQIILVQIAKEAILNKGPRLTCEITLSGRYLILIPFSNKIGISKKIKNLSERERLIKIFNKNIFKNFGIIIRTAAEGKSETDLLREAEMLIKKWENSFNEIHKLIPPVKVIGEIERTNTILRDLLNDSFENIYTDSVEISNEMKEYLKTFDTNKLKIIKTYKGTEPLFDKFGITKQLKKSLGKVVYLKHGVYLIIESTEALHVIDVNSGSLQYKDETPEQNAFKINLLATDEIARQIRLRNLGGIIIIDFVDMYNNEYKKIIYERIKELLSKDRAKYDILPLSKFGIMQITRQRLRQEVNFNVEETCPLCLGTGKISDSMSVIDNIEDCLRSIKDKIKFRAVKIIAHPFIESFLKKGFLSIRKKWCFKYKSYIKVTSNLNLSLNKFKILISNKELNFNNYEKN
ncbi:MAG: Rne/Rng family ribonuclease [Bacteroidales bacterium]|nr:Rne/Rng family ribonuclease [Bacteroidales bacterium]